MLPAAVVLVVAVMVIPLPSAVLDVLIVANLSTAILILLVSMNDVLQLIARRDVHAEWVPGLVPEPVT